MAMLQIQQAIATAAAAPGGPKLCHLLADESVLRKLAPSSNAEDCVSTLRSLDLPDSFWCDEFKVVPCAKTYSHKWTLCPCAHAGETARRRDPKTVAYKAILCPLVKAKKTCPLGDACSYAHNVFEHWLHPSRYKTRLCSFGRNCNRAICFFAHSAEELRCVPSSEDLKDTEERDYLMHLLMAQESGLLPPSALQPTSMPLQPMQGMMSADQLGTALHALQSVGSGRLPGSGRPSLSGVPDPGSGLLPARQSLSGNGMVLPMPDSGMLSARASLSGIPDAATAALLTARASYSGLMDPGLDAAVMMQQSARASYSGIPDAGQSALLQSCPSMSGAGQFGMVADPQAVLMQMQQSMAQQQHQQHAALERAYSRELQSHGTSSFGVMQRALSSDLATASGAMAAGAAAAATNAMERAFSTAAAMGLTPEQMFNAAGVASPMQSRYGTMDRALSRELSWGVSGSGPGKHSGPVPSGPYPQHGHHQQHQQQQHQQQHHQQQQHQQHQQQQYAPHGMPQGDAGSNASSGSMGASACAALGGGPANSNSGSSMERALSHSRSLGSSAVDRVLNHNASITSVESDSLVPLRTHTGTGVSNSHTAPAGTAAHARGGAVDPMSNPHQPPRLSDPGSNYLPIPAHVSTVNGHHPAANRVSDSGNTLGLLSSKDLGSLESLLPLVNTALASGQLSMPMPGSAPASQASMRVQRSSSSGAHRASAGVLSPVQQAVSPSRSGSLSPPSPSTGGLAAAAAAELDPLAAEVVLMGASGSAGLAASVTSPTVGSRGAELAALDNLLRAAAAKGALPGGGKAGAAGAQAAQQLSAGSLGDLVSRLQGQGMNKDQLVSSLSQLLAQLLSVDG